jgi:hypothetical protein
MSQLIGRILLSIFIFPLASVLYTIVCVAAFRHNNDTAAFLIAGVVTSIFIAIYWLLLWHKAVRWTNGRTELTIGAGLGSVMLAAVAGAITNSIESGFGAFVGTVTAPLLWLVATVLIWRETAEERARRLANSGTDAVVCPTCGYNLTGLKESRCPECGTQFTLDQLLASQPGRAQGEIEG